jgi:hypothetical protein
MMLSMAQTDDNSLQGTTVVRRGLWNGMWHPTVKVQVKTTVDLREADDHLAYDLDIGTYNVLRRDNESVRRVLAVFRLPKVGEKVRLLKSGTLMVGRGAWVSLEKVTLRLRTRPAGWCDCQSRILLTALALSGCWRRTACVPRPPYPRWTHGGRHDRVEPER